MGGAFLSAVFLASLMVVAPASAAVASTAYVTNFSSNNVTPIDTALGTAGTPIAVGTHPRGVAITPDGKTAYVTNQGSGTVTPINTATNNARTPIAVGSMPAAIAITPDGTTAYVVNLGSLNVTPIDLATKTAGPPIGVGNGPLGIAITPDGNTAYVTNFFSDNVTPIDTATNAAGPPIPVGDGPLGIAILPNGKAGYIGQFNSNRVARFSTQTNRVTARIDVGGHSWGVAITPDGHTAYATGGDVVGKVNPIDTSTNTAGTPITVGNGPSGIAITPGGSKAFVVNTGSANVTPITIATSSAGAPIAVGADPAGIAIAPQARPPLTIQASPGVAVGGQVHATATLADGDNPTGTITFRLYGPNDSGCAGAPAFTDTVSVSANDDYGSGSFTPTVAGNYRWRAFYSGDDHNQAAATGCKASGALVVVSKAAPTISVEASPDVPLGGQVDATATLSEGQGPTGTVTFRLYGPNDSGCSMAPAHVDTVGVTGNGDYVSDSFSPAVAGKYRWRATYSGDANNKPAASGCKAPGALVTVT